MTRSTHFLALVMALAFVHHAVAQNPTMSLIPLVENVRRECVGGPNEGQTCSTTADCEVGPECQRTCPGTGVTCECNGDCPSGSCLQECFCNHVLEASPGDVISTEVFVSEWSPNGERLRSWQASFGMVSASDAVRPVGFDQPLVSSIECSTDEQCPEEYPFCANDRAFCNGECIGECMPVECLGPDQCAFEGIFADISRTDYVFHDIAVQVGPGLDISTIEYRAGALVLAGIRYWNQSQMRPPEAFSSYECLQDSF